jgi:outer membrane lipoprotein SlyB
VKTSLFVAFSMALAGCASTAVSQRPTLYPNATYNRIGEAAAKAEVDACLDKAKTAGIKPESDSNGAGQGAARGGVMGGVAGVVGGLVTGRGIEDSLKHGAASAAVGGAVGAAGGAMRPDRANPTYRNFVQRCVSEKGLDIIGWN